MIKYYLLSTEYYANCEASKKKHLVQTLPWNQPKRLPLHWQQDLLKRLSISNLIFSCFTEYRNDHVCIAGNKWYVAEATNSMFLLMDTKASFTNAEEKCRQHNASLAMFKNNEELG